MLANTLLYFFLRAKMNNKYYTKENGKYKPSNDPYALDGLTNGIWIVVVKRGSTSCRQKLSSKHAEIVGSLEYLHEGLCKAMHKAGEMRQRNPVPISKKEKRAWEAFRKVMGKDMPSMFDNICFPSYSEIADEACEYVKNVLVENDCDVIKVKVRYEKPKEPITALDRLEV